MKRVVWMLSTLMFSLLIAACGRKAAEPKANHITWETCVRDLVDLEHLPVLNGADIKLLSSHDRSGGNNDFNFFERAGNEPGWIVLADLKGPGCIRRLWMTGTDPGHPIRIYVDGEKTPRINTTLDDLFGITEPWTAPLAQYINMCYYSYVPLTFNESIRVETKEPNVHPFWGPRRLFFQMGVQFFDAATTSVESYPAIMSDAQRQAVQQVRSAWADAVANRAIAYAPEAAPQTIAAGQRAPVYEAMGEGTVQSWSIRVDPKDAAGWTAMDRERLLQDTVVRVYYDGLSSPSIEAPLGDFFANAWRKRTYGGLWMTSGDDGYTCRLPMPYRQSIRIELENAADRDVTVHFSAISAGGATAGAGYLHAEYRRSGPTGPQPHTVAKFNGKGKYLGCFLGVTGLDPSWWILEGDERMWVDSNPKPVWLGTGLEDYFNGGWYYRGSVFGALNANFDRSPFRVAQFRHQHPDPVSFAQFFQMEFERMRNEQDGQPVNGFFQSVAYAYLEKPTPVQGVPAERNERRAVDNPNDRATFMLQLVELERGNDFRGAMRYIDEYIERYPGSEEEGVLRLRHVEYRRLTGEEVGPEAYAPFLNGDFGDEAKKQAEVLQWFYAAPNRALIGMNVNGKGRLMLDNKVLMSGDHPYYLYVVGAELDDGVHKLAAQVEFQRQEPWLQVGVRTHQGVAGTGPGTWSTRTAEAGWPMAQPSPPAWNAVDLRDVPRGVPDAPYIGGIPNAFVLVQSKAYPVRGLDWGYHRGVMYFRQDFTMPLTGWPAFSTITTGLPK